MSHWTGATRSHALTEEEKKIALSQVTGLDRFAAVGDNNRWLYGTNGSRAIVCVPPRSSSESERWVAVDPVTNAIDMSISQPHSGRTVLYACENTYGWDCYYYEDQLQCCIIWTIICTVVLSILTTPVFVPCCIPMIMKMKQAQQKFKEGDNFGARKVYKGCCTWCIGPAIWISFMLPLVLTGVILVIVFAAVGIIQ